MEELWELRRHIQAGDYEAALALLDEMEEMSRDDKITGSRVVCRSYCCTSFNRP
jgi:pentatricopeptide repeat protein